MEEKRIIVEVHGGMVEEVSIPPGVVGVVLEIRDFDIDSVEYRRLSEVEDTGHGNRAVVSEYRGKRRSDMIYIVVLVWWGSKTVKCWDGKAENVDDALWKSLENNPKSLGKPSEAVIFGVGNTVPERIVLSGLEFETTQQQRS